MFANLMECLLGAVLDPEELALKLNKMSLSYMWDLPTLHLKSKLGIDVLVYIGLQTNS